MQSKAKTVGEYLASLPDDRRAAIEAVRKVILANLDQDYEEGMQYGMISYYVPHRVFPAGYHCDPTKPLCYAGLASQKGYMSVYLMCIYGSQSELAWFRDAWAKTGKKLDMGKSCIRFAKLENLALDVIGQAIKRVPASRYVAHYTKLLESRPQPAKKPANKAAPTTSKKKVVKKAAKKVTKATKATKVAKRR